MKDRGQRAEQQHRAEHQRRLHRAAALALPGCGRKGGLDEPPLAASAPAPGGQPPAATYSPDGKPNPPAAEKRRTFLDWLID